MLRHVETVHETKKEEEEEEQDEKDEWRGREWKRMDMREGEGTSKMDEEVVIEKEEKDEEGERGRRRRGERVT